MVFDLLWLDGLDLRGVKLSERKPLLSRIIPAEEPRVRVVEHVPLCGRDFFAAACRHDVEGIVAKWKNGLYQSGPSTSWLEIDNPAYSQRENRRARSDAAREAELTSVAWPDLAPV
jgi:bifunctional non-homologous end joining protein LigD